MATNNKTVDLGQDDADEMFKAAAASGEDEFADIDDLLGEVDEDDSEGWVPSEVGEAIAGIVTKVDEIKSDFAADNDPDPMCPVVTIRCKDDSKWRIIGYGTVLKRELRDKDPKVGDKLAVKYFGEGTLRKGKFAGKSYKKFGVVVRKAVKA